MAEPDLEPAAASDAHLRRSLRNHAAALVFGALAMAPFQWSLDASPWDPMSLWIAAIFVLNGAAIACQALWPHRTNFWLPLPPLLVPATLVYMAAVLALRWDPLTALPLIGLAIYGWLWLGQRAN